LYHLGPADATPKSKKLSRWNPETPLDFFARCAIVVSVESVRDTDRANGHPNGTDTTMDENDTIRLLNDAALALTTAAAVSAADHMRAAAIHAALGVVEAILLPMEVVECAEMPEGA